jgi:hypothetical protein
LAQYLRAFELGFHAGFEMVDDGELILNQFHQRLLLG